MYASQHRIASGHWIQVASGALLALVLLPAAGCHHDPNSPKDDGGAGRDAVPRDASTLPDDAGPESDATPPTDGCTPSPELCDDIDQDCDGDPMNGFDLLTDPAHCGACGRACSLPGAEGTCEGGQCVYACSPDHQDLDGDLGEPASNGCEYACPVYPPLAEELCNGEDDDCDGLIDQPPIVGVGDECYPENLVGCEVGVGCAGTCAFGELQCEDGVEICAGFTGPEPVERCDDIDHDCDGDPRNGFDTANDPDHCGDRCTVCALPNAVNGCHDLGAGGECYVVSCLPGWENPDGDDEPTDILGCEYQCTPTGPELCDGVDNDCDTLIDEPGEYPDGISPPTGMVCSSHGECDGPTPVCSACQGVTTWRCDYRASPGAVEVGSCGELVPQETLCDGLDNDCDLLIDESFPQVAHTPTDQGDPCDDGEQGICRGTGTWICDPADASTVLCDITEPGQNALTMELCNNLDDNCNGLVDELEHPPGNFIMSDSMAWVSSGTTSSGVFVWSFRIDRYEASHPDADATSVGTADHLACSNPGVMPWRTVTHARAEAACLAAGKRLCTAAEWQRACEGAGPFGASYSSYPYGVAYDPHACNGWDYDFDCTAPNDHFLLYPTGSAYGCPPEADSCSSEFDILDLSGNLQEWTGTILSTGPDHYGVRGGSYESPPGELTCQSDSIAFDDTVELPNLGFRCCQDTP